MDETLRGIFHDVLGVREADFRDGLSPDDVPNWDSVQHITLMLSIEQAFGVSIDPEEAARLRSVGAIRELLAQRGAAG